MGTGWDRQRDGGRAHSLGLHRTTRRKINTGVGSGKRSPRNLPLEASAHEQQPLGSSGLTGAIPLLREAAATTAPRQTRAAELLTVTGAVFSRSRTKHSAKFQPQEGKKPNNAAALCSRGRKLGSHGVQAHPGPLGLVATTPPFPLPSDGEGLGRFH